MNSIHSYISVPITVKWGGKNKSWYTALGYDFTGIGNSFFVNNPEHIMRESSVRVEVECPTCGERRIVDYKGLRRSNNAQCVTCVNINNIENMRFGNLVAVKQAKQPKWISESNRKKYWLFRCDCGEEKVILGTDVTSGKTISCGCFQRERVGENHPSWKGDATNRSYYRPDKRIAKWRGGVFARDGRKCVICGSSDNIVAHHINGYHWAKSMRFDNNNGVTMCSVCHIEFHSIYGWRNSCDIQFQDYMDNYMSGKRSITKGRSGERQAARAIKEIFDVNVFRGVQYSGGADSPDIKGLSPYGLHCEVKRDESTISKRVDSELNKTPSIGTYKGEDVVYVIPLNRLIESLSISDMPRVKVTKSMLNALSQAERDSGELIPFVLSRRNYGVWYVCVKTEKYCEFIRCVQSMPIKNTAQK